MSGIIIYKSKYGSTEKYAKWLSEETGFDYVTTDKADINKVASHDVVIVAGAVYASGISCLSYLKKNINKLKDKKIVVFTCAASPYDEKFFNELVKNNMKDELEGIPVFYGRGGFNMKAMSFTDRTLCKMLRKAVSKKDPKEYEIWEKALMEVDENEVGDWTDKSYLEPLIKYLNEV